VSDIDTAVVDSLKVLDPKRPIREADIGKVAALYLPLAVPLHLFTSDALGRTSQAEQTSQIFSGLPSRSRSQNNQLG
jgi:hypothetical protein